MGCSKKIFSSITQVIADLISLIKTLFTKIKDILHILMQILINRGLKPFNYRKKADNDKCYLLVSNVLLSLSVLLFERSPRYFFFTFGGYR